MDVIQGLMVAAVALVALLAWRRAGNLEKEIEFVRRRNQDRVYELAEEIERLAEEINKLQARVRRRVPSRFAADTLIEELPLIHPSAPAVLASVQAGAGCSCSTNPEATLAQTIAQNGGDLSLVLTSLNALLDGQSSIHRDLERIGTGGLLQIQPGR